MAKQIFKKLLSKQQTIGQSSSSLFFFWVAVYKMTIVKRLLHHQIYEIPYNLYFFYFTENKTKEVKVVDYIGGIKKVELLSSNSQYYTPCYITPSAGFW